MALREYGYFTPVPSQETRDILDTSCSNYRLLLREPIMDKKHRILIVDDHTLLRAGLRALLLQDVGFEVVGEAENGRDAIRAVSQLTPDLVLMDIRMPGVDGMTLARTMRAMPQAPAVVFVTAHAEYAVQAFDLEAVDYLTKPVRLERLQAALEKAGKTSRLVVYPGLDHQLDDSAARTDMLGQADAFFRTRMKIAGQ